MVRLILLNGPPASGKSTIASRYVDARPLSLSLDIDVVRGMLGGWLDAPTPSGLAARSLALSMAQTHLAAGHDVVVPQFLGRPEFIDQLAAVAAGTRASFIETALCLDRTTAIAAFAERREAPTSQTHDHAAALVDRSEHADPIGEMYDLFSQLIERRPSTRRVDVARGDIELTFRRFCAVLEVRSPQT